MINIVDIIKVFKTNIKIIKLFIIRIYSFDKNYMTIAFFITLIKSISPFINIIMMKYLIDELLNQQRKETLMLYICIIVFGNLIFSLLNRFLDFLISIKNMKLLSDFELDMGKYIMDMEFQYLEDNHVLDEKEKALYAINTHNAIQRSINGILDVMQSIFSIVGLIAIISTLNILLVVLVLLMIYVNMRVYSISQKTQFRFHKEIIPLNRQYTYHNNLAIDFSIAKDIRIYNMSSYIQKRLVMYNEKIVGVFGKMFSAMRFYDGITSLNIQVQILFIYIYMVIQVYREVISIGEFSMYTATVIAFSSCVTGILSNFISLRQTCEYLNMYLNFNDASRVKAKKADGISDFEIDSIEFKNVWFRYPNTENYILRNINIRVNKNDHISIVGKNGSGKTTLIKLLCGLYEPEKGEILINNLNIKNYDYDVYIDKLAVVFQDFNIMSFSIKDNIDFHKDTPATRLWDILKQVGLLEKVKGLPQQLNTYLYKEFEDNSTELSGGEMQKIAIARAICKNAPIVILDEPTASLDPYAEYDMYCKFREFTQEKTVIYISHRLSSCKLCRQIFVFDEGEIIENGDFQELYERKGLFRELWDSQAEYYSN